MYKLRCQHSKPYGVVGGNKSRLKRRSHAWHHEIISQLESLSCLIMSSAVPEDKATSGDASPRSACDDSMARTMWQDDLCMEPIRPVPGFSKLCNACIKIFRYDTGQGNPGDKEDITRVRHIRYSEVLSLSGSRGCRLCALLLTDIQKRAVCLHVAMTSVIGLHFSRSFGKFYSGILFLGTELPSWHFALSVYPVEGQSIPAGSSVS